MKRLLLLLPLLLGSAPMLGHPEPIQDWKVRQAQTKEEFDQWTLIRPRRVKHTLFRAGVLARPERYEAQTLYGRYVRQGNQIIAHLPDGSVGYFLYNETTLQGEELGGPFDDWDLTMPDKRMRCPESCIRCHQGKFVPE